MTQHSLTQLSNVTPIRLTPPGIHSGMDITLQNINDVGNIYIGGENLSFYDYGYKIFPKTGISFELPGNDALYAIADIDAIDVAIMQTGLEMQN